VAGRVREQVGRGADDARHVARRIDDRVPLAPFEGGQVAVAVAAQLLGLGEELRVRLAAVEERDLVPLRKRGLGDGPPQELRPAEQQQSQWNL
jgi:hypothetical protein